MNKFKETINQHDNVTLHFMSGIHNVCWQQYFPNVTATVFRMTGKNQTVSVRGNCNINMDNGPGGLSFSQENSSLFVDHISFVNFTGLPNANLAVFKCCSFNCVKIPTFSNLIVEDCIFSKNNSTFYSGKFRRYKNCTFYNSSLI